MKIEETEAGMRLIPENQWEKEKLEVLRKRSRIDSIRFEDDWNSTGYLELRFPTHPCDNERY